MFVTVLVAVVVGVFDASGVGVIVAVLVGVLLASGVTVGVRVGVFEA